jgi:phosphoribosylaminoimidazolecarboxamide formyltransferase/IMP cyclohydrolase
MAIEIKTALLSTHSKDGLSEFARFLHGRGVKLISTGGTASFLEKADLPVTKVSDLTGFPEILGGRVKTLHPAIHGGILADTRNPAHVEELKKLGLFPIDLVVVNLYPFQEVVARGCTLEEAIENIDIGGVTLLRASAKNYHCSVIVSEPADYARIQEALQDEGGIPLEMSRELALKAFRTTCGYDGAIGGYLAAQGAPEGLPDTLRPALRRVMPLRYGENPHQKAALYQLETGAQGVHRLRQHQGKELSFNNLLDIDNAWRIVSAFSEPCCVIVKHNSPCGVAVGRDGAQAFAKAWECDPKSAFGGIIAFNRPIDASVARAIVPNFIEVVVAPDYAAGTLEVFVPKKNVRVLSLPVEVPRTGWDMKRVNGGLLLQEWDQHTENLRNSKVVTKRAPSDAEWKDLEFAWEVVKGVKSNAVIYAKDGQTLALGCGQTSRVDAAVNAAAKAILPLKGSVVASDGFFPFPDNVEEIGKAGATAIIQPGGSIRDVEVIRAADEAGLAMVFTGCRHFRH